MSQALLQRWWRVTLQRGPQRYTARLSQADADEQLLAVALGGKSLLLRCPMARKDKGGENHLLLQAHGHSLWCAESFEEEKPRVQRAQ